jgi:hypothetical protein
LASVGQTLSPSTSITGATKPTQAPSVDKTDAIPSAPAEEIQAACSGDDIILLLSTGDMDARTGCIGACQDGLCCYAKELGFEWLPSCYEGNEQVCAEYALCLSLVMPELQEENATVIEESNAPAVNETVGDGGPPIPTNITIRGVFIPPPFITVLGLLLSQVVLQSTKSLAAATLHAPSFTRMTLNRFIYFMKILSSLIHSLN